MDNNKDILKELNKQLSKVKLQDVKGYLSVRGQFPDENGNNVRKRISLSCKNNQEGRKIALGKAKEIDSQLLLEKWQVKQKNKLTFGEAIAQYTNY